MNEIDGTGETPDEPETIAKWLVARADAHPDMVRLLIERWGHAPTWTKLEGIALAWTLDPNSVISKSRFASAQVATERLPEEAHHYLELARRSGDQDFVNDRISPKAFIDWAHAIGLDFHRDWWSGAGATHPSMRELVQLLIARPTGAALVDRWAVAPFWRLEEGAALWAGKEPTEVIRKSVTGYALSSLDVSVDALHVFDLSLRAAETDMLPEKPSPREFLDWSASIGHPFSDEWEAAVAEAEQRRSASAEGDNERSLPVSCDAEGDFSSIGQELGTRERDNVSKLVIGLAIKGYGYDPKRGRSEVTKDICGDLEKLGLKLSRDTIMKWLKAGAELLPRGSDGH